MLEIPDRKKMAYYYYGQMFRWLYTGIRLEREGFPSPLVDKCLNKAAIMETHHRNLVDESAIC